MAYKNFREWAAVREDMDVGLDGATTPGGGNIRKQQVQATLNTLANGNLPPKPIMPGVPPETPQQRMQNIRTAQQLTRTAPPQNVKSPAQMIQAAKAAEVA